MINCAGLKELAEKATPGPWFAEQGDVFIVEYDSESPPDRNLLAQSNSTNAAYNAAASPDKILALLAEIERLRAALETIFKQKKTTELETMTDVEYADFEQGYDGMIDFARAVLGEK